MSDVFERLERFYDAVPREEARVETFGGLVLFVREGPGWPFYARPSRDPASAPTVDDIVAVRERQRDLGLPESFEWVHETTPTMRDTARLGGLAILDAPLLVLDEGVTPPVAARDVRIVDAASPTFANDAALARAVANVAFGMPGTMVGDAGPAERDAARSPLSDRDVADLHRHTVSGRRITALADDPQAGVLGSGMVQGVGDVAELVGIATLPQARRRGFGGAITAALVAEARRVGAGLIFLSAGNHEIARVYERAGFRPIGTACIAEPALGSR